MIKFLSIAGIICLILLCASLVYRYYAEYKIQQRASLDFKSSKDIIVEKNGYTALILLHGFSTGPQEFDPLLPYLNQKNISYMVPNLEGHNQINTESLEKVTFPVWEKQVLDLYEQVSKKYKHIDVIGYSNGANLAFKLLETNKIRHLILINPFSTPNEGLLKLHKYSQNNFLNMILDFFIAYIPMDPQLNRPVYQYPYVPYKSLIEILNLQSTINFNQVKTSDIFLIYAKKDDLSDFHLLMNDKLANRINSEDVLVLKNSSHRALEENERDQVERFLDKIY